MTASGAGVFRSLRIFNYRVWAVGALVSNVGTWMQRTAQDWLVLTELTHKRHRRRRRHGAAVRAAAPVAAADGIRGRSPRPAQAAAGHAGGDGRAGARRSGCSPSPASSSSGTSTSSRSCSAARRRSTRRRARPSSSELVRRGRPVQRRRAQLHLVQRRAHDRSRRRGRPHRRVRAPGGSSSSTARRSAPFCARSRSSAWPSCTESRGRAAQGGFAEGLSLRAEPARPHGDPRSCCS